MLDTNEYCSILKSGLRLQDQYTVTDVTINLIPELLPFQTVVRKQHRLL